MRRDRISFDLVLRGTRDGFSLETFHEKLDGKGPLIFFVRSADHNKVFGGYTSKPWTTPASHLGKQQYHYDHNAFIFSLSKKTKHIPFQNEHNAVEHYREGALFAFGWGDFGIRDNCDQREDSWSNFGCTKWTKHTYTLPRNLKANSDDAYKYLAGGHLFKVQELEVF
jgi:hypothetical protein